MRSIWFSLIGPTVSEVEAHLLASGCVQTEGQGSALNYPAGDACVLLIDCDDYRWVERWELQDEYEDLCSAIGEQTPTVHVLAHVSGRVPGDEEVRFLARCLLERFDGYAFDDYLGYTHAWCLAEILASARVNGLHFFDYRGHYQEQQKR